MWAGNVLIDCLLLCLKDTRYYKGVAVDPVNHDRPTTLQQAINLLDKHHSVLLMRGQAHGGGGKTPVTPRTAAGASGSQQDGASKAEKRKALTQPQQEGLPRDEFLAAVNSITPEEVRERSKKGLCPACVVQHQLRECELYTRKEWRARRDDKGKACNVFYTRKA